MKYALSLSGDTFMAAKTAFDSELRNTIKKMQKLEISEGAVTLKLEIMLEKQFPVDEDGTEREVYVPRFEHDVASALTIKEKSKGKLVGDFVLSTQNGIPVLYDRDNQTIFDMLDGIIDEKEGGQDEDCGTG